MLHSKFQVSFPGLHSETLSQKLKKEGREEGRERGRDGKEEGSDLQCADVPNLTDSGVQNLSLVNSFKAFPDTVKRQQMSFISKTSQYILP